MRRTTLLLLLLLAPLAFLMAQDMQLIEFNDLRLRTNRRAMTVLGGWAVGNIAVGSILMNQREGSDKYFHQMNVGWNAINLGIASFAYWAALKSDPASFTLIESLEEQQKIQKVLLFNAGLDIGYIAGGLYLMERSKNTEKNSDRLKGFGQSILLQGAFLFVFDLGSFFVHQSHDKVLHKLISGLRFDGTNLGLSIAF
ncbi:MAG: hypothetical protein AAFV25_14280 [Bacteroidota bacterium]